MVPQLCVEHTLWGNISHLEGDLEWMEEVHRAHENTTLSMLPVALSDSAKVANENKRNVEHHLTTDWMLSL